MMAFAMNVTIDVVTPQQAHAGFFSSVFKGIKKAVKKVTKVVSSVAKKAVKEIRSSLRNSVRYLRKPGDLYSSFMGRTAWVSTMLQGCSDSKVHGMRTHCFNSAKRKRMANAMEIMKRNNGHIAYGNKKLRPYNHTKKHTHSIWNASSSRVRGAYLGAVSDKDNYGQNLTFNSKYSSKGLVFLTDARFKGPDAGVAGTLLHEAHHTKTGEHSCGSAADKDDRGPYGVQVRLLAKAYHDKKISKYDRTLVKYEALSRIKSRFCNNKAVQNKLAKLF